MVLQDEYCEKCGEEFANAKYKWCKPCQIVDLKKNLTNWTSKNEKIDYFIQEMRLKIDNHNDIIIEWIPYNQFDKIKEIIKDCFFTTYSAIWKDGPLKYDNFKKIYKRNLENQNQKFFLKCYNSQNTTNEFFNEV